MNGGRLLAALGVVGVTSTVFLLAYIANAWSVIHAGQVYTPPRELVDIIKLVFTAAIGILTIGAISEYRRINSPDDDEDLDFDAEPKT